MKKRIFISIPSLNIGGAETALIGMLQTFDYSKVDVDLFVYSHEGPFMRYIPSSVNLLPENVAYKLTYVGDSKRCIKAGLWKLAFAMVVARCRMKLYAVLRHPKTFDAIYSFQGDILTKALPVIDIKCRYDLAISFVVPHSYVLDHVKADRYMGWIHTDYAYIDVNQRLERQVWGRLDKIISISSDVTKSFVKVFPELTNKISIVENIVSPEFVRQRAKEFFPCEYKECVKSGRAIICSMGRICYQKNFENIPRMAKELRRLGIDFKWFIIGPGDPSVIMASAKKLGVDDCVVFLGPRDNPCPYVKNCMVYVQPSRYEGKSIAVREAQILCKPVVVSNYQTASSQVRHGIDGIILNLDNDAIARGIADLLSDKTKYDSIVKYLQAHDYGNENEIEAIYRLAGI